MTADLSGLHGELRTAARDLLGRPGLDAGRVAEAGWFGLEVPEALDGAGAGFAETAIVIEEMGRAAARTPYLGAVLAVEALNLLEPGPGRDRLLRETASGAVLPVLALSGELPGGLAGGFAGGLAGGRDGACGFRMERSPDGPLLHGRAAFVPDAPEAGRLLLPALDLDGVPVLLDAAPGAAGLGVTAQPVLDETRRLGAVTADGAVAGDESVRRFGGDPGAALRRLADRAAFAIACDSLGLSEAMLDATVAYAGVRHQFGRPIGSFQAVKHACADMLVEISVARRLVAAAVRALAAGDPGAGVAASMAKSYTSAAAVGVTGRAMQLHGGMGYTWESGVHVHLKRAALNRSLFGSPSSHRRRIADRYQ